MEFWSHADEPQTNISDKVMTEIKVGFEKGFTHEFKGEITKDSFQKPYKYKAMVIVGLQFQF